MTLSPSAGPTVGSTFWKSGSSRHDASNSARRFCGGVGQGAQIGALRRSVDVLIATPGRLLDLVDQGHVDLSEIEFFVLDDADRMLDMGFMPALKRIR